MNNPRIRAKSMACLKALGRGIRTEREGERGRGGKGERGEGESKRQKGREGERERVSG